MKTVAEGFMYEGELLNSSVRIGYLGIAPVDEGKATIVPLVLRTDAEAAIQKAQDDALEEAAKIADKWATNEQRTHGKGGPAAEILALKGKPCAS